MSAAVPARSGTGVGAAELSRGLGAAVAPVIAACPLSSANSPQPGAAPVGASLPLQCFRKDMKKQPVIVGVIGGIVGTVLVGILVWLIVVYTGAYNVAATDRHGDAVLWTLDTTMHRSVANRATAVDLPERIPESLLSEGAAHYADSCAHCHGAPGEEASRWSRGMRPQPPHLTEAAAHWTPDEIHWIVTNGIKMTGMPAFGGHRSPDELVALTAFVSALPGLTAEDYRSLTGSARDRAQLPTGLAEDALDAEPQGGAVEAETE